MKKLDVSKGQLNIQSRAVKMIGELRGAKPGEVLCVARVERDAGTHNEFSYKVILKNGEVL